jgi:hypothetical protein
MSLLECPECGARYDDHRDSCTSRFETLLALDHSRQEPWGSRHGQAFAAFSLQHPRRYASSVDRAWEALYRVYCLGEPAAHVFAGLRARAPAHGASAAVPPHPAASLRLPSVTIADLGDFEAARYAAQLDAWCLATLSAWGAALDRPAI